MRGRALLGALPRVCTCGGLDTMSGIYLTAKALRARVREAEAARRNRAEIVRELSWGRVSRRDLIRMGLFTGAGLLSPIRGLSPFARSVYADGGTGLPPS